jgi:hypothetical protein
MGSCRGAGSLRQSQRHSAAMPVTFRSAIEVCVDGSIPPPKKSGELDEKCEMLPMLPQFCGNFNEMVMKHDDEP